MTASSADFLSATYGGGMSIDAFAESLPLNATVVDVGAGLSNLGSEVAARRDDISWTNYDYNYGVPDGVNSLLDEVKSNAPRNVAYVTGDALDFPTYMTGSYDRVYSYNLVSHLLRIKQALGDKALQGMVELLTQDGELHVGPTNAKMATDSRWKTTQLHANASEAEFAEAEKLLTSPRLASMYYYASLSSGVGVYPAKRFSQEISGKLVLSDDGGQTIHKLLSPRGVALTTRLVSGLFHS